MPHARRGDRAARLRAARGSAELHGHIGRICRPSVNKAKFKKQSEAPTATEHKEYPGRCHFPGQDGWEQVADYILAWTTERARSAAPTSA